jgi:hypothetical protein
MSDDGIHSLTALESYSRKTGKIMSGVKFFWMQNLKSSSHLVWMSHNQRLTT